MNTFVQLLLTPQHATCDDSVSLRCMSSTIISGNKDHKKNHFNLIITYANGSWCKLSHGIPTTDFLLSNIIIGKMQS